MKIKKNYLFFFIFFCFFKVLIFLFFYKMIIKDKNINLVNVSLCNSKFLQEQDINFENELKNIDTDKFKVLLKIKESFPQYFQESNEDKNSFLLNHILILILGELKNHNYQWFNKYKESNLIFKEYLSILEKYDLFNEFGYKIEEIVFDPNKYIFILPGNYNEFNNYDKYLFYKENSFKIDSKGFFWSNWYPKNLLFISKSYLDIILKLSTTIWELKNNPIQKSFIEEELNIFLKKHLLLSKADTDVHYMKNKIKKLKNSLNSENKIIYNLTIKIQEKERQYRQQMNLSEEERQQLKEDIDTLRNQLSNSQDQIEGQKKTLDKAQQDLQKTSYELTNIREELKKDLQLNKGAVDQLTSELNVLTDKHTALNHDLDEMKQDNQILKDHNKQLESQLIDLKTEVSSLQNRITEQRGMIDSISDLVSETRKQQKELDENIDSLTIKIQEKERQYRQQMNLSEEERQQLKEDIDTLRNQLSNSQDQIEGQKKTLDKAQQDLQKTSYELTNIREELKKDLQLNKGAVDQLTSELNVLTDKHTALNHDLDEMTKNNNFLIDFTDRFFYSLKSITSSFLKQLDKQKSENIKNNFLNVSAQKFAKDTSQMPLFGELIGMKKEKDQLQDYLNYLRDTNKYSSMGMKKFPKGIILYGPPGTGKTHLAEAFARESGLSVFSLSSSDFSKTYVGEAPRLIENLFIEARKKFPSIILIDECESVFRSRSSNSLTNDHGNVIAAFLSYLEGVHEDKEKPVFIVAMTNILEEIDSAILSRFDKRIKVDLWDFSSIQEFLKLKAINYKLDLMAYDYLINYIPNIIFKFNYDELKTPRGLISLLNQAVTISQRSNHQHSYVTLIDLQLSLDLKLGLNKVNWENHQHKANSWQDLVFIKEYNGISIKQLFEDNDFEKLELEYYKLIKNNIQKNKKPVYISFKKDGSYFYDIDLNDNMWPSSLLGFYLDVQEDVITDNLDNLKISNPEDILRLYIQKYNYKVNRIYFVWDLFKQKEIDFLLLNKWEIFVQKYPFLKTKYHIMRDEVNPRINSLNDLELNELLNDWIKQFKNKWIQLILPKMKLSEKTIYDLFNLNIVNLIEEEINFFWQEHNLSEENCLEKIIMRLNENFYNLFKDFIRTKTSEIINNINLNKKIFSSFQIEHIKEYLKKTTIQEFEKDFDLFSQKNISSEEILIKIFINQEKYFNQQDSLYYKLWQEQIYKYLDISLPIFEQLKLKQYLIQHLIKTYFQQDLELSNIIEQLNEKIDLYQQQFEQKLEKKINKIVNKYFLSNYFQDYPDFETLNFINKRANIWINHNLKSDKTIKSEQEIENIVFNFLQQYAKDIINNKQKNNFFVENNFVKIIIFIFLLFCVFYLLRSNNLKK
ncbi:AAA family ATPase [Candidatus Phytoplasma fabacearum]|nr:AAA family ATPase ['Bituminaria bituminosa' little leaf phytoplasma]MDO8023790.1 AAA family ATPase ['Bituminaria bituminosa' little leaf phytoplasma]MDO8030391.1 AAA family ATPase ['Bituminaria bituminosa' little leaf phytoplasma]